MGRVVFGPGPRALAVLLILTLPASGGTRRHDVDDSVHTSLALEPPYQSVGRIAGSASASGVLVAPNYVLTAAHVTGTSFTLPSGTDTRVWRVVHPGWTGEVGNGYDLTIWRLSTLNLTETPAALYTDDDEVGQIGIMVGYGRTGDGLTGDINPSGTKRAGPNVFDVAGTGLGYPDHLLLADFDNPTPFSGDNRFGRWQPLDHEFCIASGDSGGGMFLEDGGTEKLAGIHSFLSYIDGTANADYGDAMAVTRVSQFLDWIEAGLTESYTFSYTGGAAPYNDAANWQTTFDGAPVQAVPGARDVLRFDAGPTSTVYWPATTDLENRRAVVDAGQVTLDFSGRTHSLTSTDAGAPSLVVGESAGTATGLTATDGTLAVQDAWIGAAPGADATFTVDTDAVWDADGAVFVGGTDAGPGGAGCLRVWGWADLATPLTVWTGGRVEVGWGTLTTPRLDLAGGTLAGFGTFAIPVHCTGGAVNIATGQTLTTTGPLDLADGAVLTKTGLGTWTLDGPVALAGQALLDVGAGTMDLNTDGGEGLSVAVTEATLHLGVDQHLDTLSIGEGGLVVCDGARELVLRALDIAAAPALAIGAVAAAPEPGALALAALGGLAILRRRRASSALSM